MGLIEMAYRIGQKTNSESAWRAWSDREEEFWEDLPVHTALSNSELTRVLAHFGECALWVLSQTSVVELNIRLRGFEHILNGRSEECESETHSDCLIVRSGRVFVCCDVHTHIHTFTHAYIHSYIHSYIETQIGCAFTQFSLMRWSDREGVIYMIMYMTTSNLSQIRVRFESDRVRSSQIESDWRQTDVRLTSG